MGHFFPTQVDGRYLSQGISRTYSTVLLSLLLKYPLIPGDSVYLHWNIFLYFYSETQNLFSLNDLLPTSMNSCLI